jgi:hypothetical protein
VGRKNAAIPKCKKYRFDAKGIYSEDGTQVKQKFPGSKQGDNPHKDLNSEAAEGFDRPAAGEDVLWA